MKDFLRRAPHVHIITFSGAHSTGKSTLIGDLKKSLEENQDNKVFTIPSCSSEWAKRKGIAKYDDINKLGLRREMQYDLPGILRHFIEDCLESDEMSVGEGNKFILCDRWFSDIRTYSKLELGDGYKDLDTEMNVQSRTLFDVLIESAYYHGSSMTMTHVFVPVHSCKHLLQVGVGDGKFRATMDHNSWESAYGEVGVVHTPPERTEIISSSDRHLRVAEVTRRIRGLHNFGCVS